jgi:DNA end-binding protein Ku
MVDRWDPDKYRDDYRNDLMKMIDERVKAGQLESAPETEEEEPKPARGQVVDLMALLKRSVEERGSGGKSGGAHGTKTAAKKPAAKSAAKKPAAKKAAKKPAKKPAAKKPAAAKRKSA